MKIMSSVLVWVGLILSSVSWGACSDDLVQAYSFQTLEVIVEALEENGWNLNNAAKDLGWSKSRTIRSLRFGLTGQTRTVSETKTTSFLLERPGDVWVVLTVPEYHFYRLDDWQLVRVRRLIRRHCEASFDEPFLAEMDKAIDTRRRAWDENQWEIDFEYDREGHPEGSRVVPSDYTSDDAEW